MEKFITGIKEIISDNHMKIAFVFFILFATLMAMSSYNMYFINMYVSYGVAIICLIITIRMLMYSY